MGGTVIPTPTYTDYANQAASYGYTPSQSEYTGMIADGTFDSTMGGFGTNQNNSWFDTPGMSGMDWAKTGIGGINSIVGILGAIDQNKTNKLARKGMEQNQQHAKMARQDRTNFLQGTASAFA